MKGIWYPAVGLLVGIFLGIFLPVSFPKEYLPYVAIGILACVDAVLGGIRANLRESFDMRRFLSGFFGNAFLAVVLTWAGAQLNIQLSLAAVVVYGARLFENFAGIRRFMLNKIEKQAKIKMEE